MTLRNEIIMMSQTVIVNFEMVNRTEFSFTLKVHHDCKTTWFSVINEKLDCKEDDREDALTCDNNTAGIFKKDDTLVGHITIEPSNLINYFLKDREES